MNPLIAEQLASDPRLEQAKRLALEALTEHQCQLAGVRSADPERQAGYAQLVAQFGQMRGGALYFPYLGSGAGRGPLVELRDGSVKYDMISGIGVHYLGHGHPALAAAQFDAAFGDVAMQGNLQQNVESAALARDLLDAVGRAGSELRHCFLASSGAMANENALKLVFQRHQPADRVLAVEQTFAGRTLALSQISDKPAYRAGLPLVLAVDYVPFFDHREPAASTARALAALKGHLDHHPGRHAAMWFEMVLGEGGYYPGDQAYFRALMEELKGRAVAVVVDEVQTFGRTGSLFAFEHFGVADLVDVVTVGKCLQVCATLFRPSYRPKPGLLSQTFTGSTSAILAGRCVLRELIGGGYFGPSGRIAQVHARFVQHLEAIGQRHPGWIGGPYGLGAMIAFTPFDGAPDTAAKLLHQLFDAGVIAFYAGAGPTRVRFLPPVGAIADADIDAVCAILESSLASVAAGH